MAIYHYQLKTISRSEGRTAMASVAYRAGEKVHDIRTGLTFDYSRRSGVLLAEIILPDGGTAKREELWNAVELAEKRRNSVVAREIVVAIPHELSQEAQIKLVKTYAQGLIARTGWGVDVAIHHPGQEGDMRNIHAHLVCTTRSVSRNESGCPVMGSKTRNWDQRASGSELIRSERSEWERCVNQALENAEIQSRVDCRSHAEKGTGLLPEIHLGPEATQLERKGIQTEQGNVNRAIQAHNANVVVLANLREEKAFCELLVDLPSLPLVKQQAIRDSYQPKSIDQLIAEDKAVSQEQARLDTLQSEKEEIEQSLSHLEAEKADTLYQWDLFNLTRPLVSAMQVPVPEIAQIKASLLKLGAEQKDRQQALTTNQSAMQQVEERLNQHREMAMLPAEWAHSRQVVRFNVVDAIVRPQEQAREQAQQAEELALWSRMSIEGLQGQARLYAVLDSRQVALEYPEVQEASKPLERYGPYGEWEEKRQKEALQQARAALSRSTEGVMAWRRAHPFQAKLYDLEMAFPTGAHQDLFKVRMQQERKEAQVKHAWQQFRHAQAKAKETLEKAIQSVMPKAEKEAQERQRRHATIQQILTIRLDMQRQQEIEKQKRDRDHGQGQGWSR